MLKNQKEEKITKIISFKIARRKRAVAAELPIQGHLFHVNNIKNTLNLAPQSARQFPF